MAMVEVCEGEMTSVSPGSVEEIAGVLRGAHERGLRINPWGGGTKQDWCGAAGPSIVLKMHRMGRVLEHVWQDMTCTVEAGCSWNAMQTKLAEHGQFVALDPVFGDRATVGGNCATNDSGSLRLRYGSLRDLIIGMTIVLADGTIAKTGGKVVKNVAGYDLHKLMTGAFGTLGVIAEVTFRLHSVPPHTASFTVTSGEVEALGVLMMRVMDSHLSTQRMQMRSSETGWCLDVALSSLPEVVGMQAAGLASMAQKIGASIRQADGDVWRAREGCFDRGGGIVAKLTMLPSAIASVSVAVSELGGRSVAQAGGVMVAAFPEASAGGLEVLRRRVEAAKGSLVLLRVPDGTTLNRWGAEPDTLPLMRAIKDRFDPKGIFNPGRFLGGI